MEDRIFRYAILISLLLHAAFFVKLAAEGKIRIVPKKEAELTYRISPPKPRDPEVKVLSKEVKSREAAPVALSPKIPSSGSPLLQDMPGMGRDFKMFERAPDKLKGLKLTKEVSVPMLKSEKINTPSYVSYYQVVRDRIRERAYNNYTKLSAGEIYLTFIIKADGTLSELKVFEEKSSANEFLREVGQSSVREAGPFPPFPNDLNYPELTFNVQISFQYREE